LTHEELLTRVNGNIVHFYGGFGHNIDAGNMFNALRAVVELHKPFMGNTLELCKECSQLRKVDDPVITYPCPTIQAITKELNG
jgi:hypothetical protein